MAASVTSLTYRTITITSSNGKQVDLTNQTLFVDYYEDILSPCVTADIQLASTYSIYNGLPIRGGERVDIEIETYSGVFSRLNNYSMYVYKVSGIVNDGQSEYCTIHLCSREALTNETARVQKKYEKSPIDEHVKAILNDVLETKKFKSENIEKTSNSYSFIGTMKKPFHVLTWLCPKGMPSNSSSGKNGNKAKGVGGYLFYENQEGFNFRSIDSLVSSTKSQSGNTSRESIPVYTYTSVTQAGDPAENFRVMNYNVEKNINLQKALRVGMYSNITYFYDLYKNRIDYAEYNLDEEIKSKSKLGGSNSIPIPEDFKGRPSRILFRSLDAGVYNPNGKDKEESGRDVADMAKSFSRYNLLFTQSLNMIVPMNINLVAGGLIIAQFQKVEPSENKEVDPQQSGKYLIKEVRHHFEAGQSVTSLKLVRDSYGLYGAKQ